jgi:hypothetical protein
MRLCEVFGLGVLIRKFHLHMHVATSTGLL